MLSKIKLFYFVLIISALLGACAQDGEVGPQGEKGDQGLQGEQGIEGDGVIFKMGYFKGTINGTRTDGTAITQDFSYEYTYDTISSFFVENGEKYIDFNRQSGGSNMNMRLKATGGNLVSTTPSWSTYFNFEKAFDSETLFSITVNPSFDTIAAYVLPISREANKKCGFKTYDWSWETYYDSYTYYLPEETYAHRFSSTLNNTEYYVFYKDADGVLAAIYNKSTSQYETEGEAFDLYNGLKFLKDEAHDKRLFFDAATEEAKYEEIPATADQLIITNYKHDDATGILTFDFELNVSQYAVKGRKNSTLHDLTISGSFNSGSPVYSAVVNRIGE